MEIVNIEAVTFSKMKAALEELVGKLQDGNKVDGKYGVEEWLDNQDVCRLLDISPSKLLTLRRSGAVAYSRIDRKIFYKREDIRKFMEQNYKGKKRHDYDTHTAQRRKPRSHPLFPSSGIPRRLMGERQGEIPSRPQRGTLSHGSRTFRTAQGYTTYLDRTPNQWKTTLL